MTRQAIDDLWMACWGYLRCWIWSPVVACSCLSMAYSGLCQSLPRSFVAGSIPRSNQDSLENSALRWIS